MVIISDQEYSSTLNFTTITNITSKCYIFSEGQQLTEQTWFTSSAFDNLNCSAMFFSRTTKTSKTPFYHEKSGPSVRALKLLKCDWLEERLLIWNIRVVGSVFKMAERRKGQVDAGNLGYFYYDWASSKYKWAAGPKKVRCIYFHTIKVFIFWASMVKQMRGYVRFLLRLFVLIFCSFFLF